MPLRSLDVLMGLAMPAIALGGAIGIAGIAVIMVRRG